MDGLMKIGLSAKSYIQFGEQVQISSSLISPKTTPHAGTERLEKERGALSEIRTENRDREARDHHDQTPEEVRLGRQFIKYTFFKILPSWRSKDQTVQEKAKNEFEEICTRYSAV